MHITGVINELQKFVAKSAKSASKPKSKPVQRPAAGKRAVSDDEHLSFEAGRIVAALDLEKRGVTVETLVSKVKAFESAAYQGTIQ